MPKGVYVRRRRPLAERFEAKVDKNGPVPPHRPELGPCWLWTGYVKPNGYGQIGLGGAGEGVEYAHRVAFFLKHGRYPKPGYDACHACDVRRCVNYEAHIFEGTRAENIQDLADKGRHGRQTRPERTARGERNGHARLSHDQVVEIRTRYAAGETPSQLARAFDVVKGTIGHIVAGRNWQ